MGASAARWSYAGLELDDAELIKIMTIDGYSSVPPLRGGGISLASVPGERFTKKLHAARKIGLDLLLYNRNVDPVALHRRLDALAKVLNVQQVESPLTHYHPDGTVRTAQAHCVAYDPKDVSQIGSVYLGTCDFLLSDPYFYTADITKVVPIPSSPVTYSIVHPGTVRGYKSIITITGPLANPTITNAANGVSVQLLVTVASGQVAVIDSLHWTATNNAVNAIGSIRHSGAFEFMVIEPGLNSLTLTATGVGSGASLTHVFSPSWI